MTKEPGYVYILTNPSFRENQAFSHYLKKKAGSL